MITGREARSTGKKRRYPWAFWLGLLVTVGCLVWAFWALDWAQVKNQLFRARLDWLLVATGALFARIVSRTARWRVFFTSPRPPFVPALIALLVGQTVNYIAPVWAGDLGRAYLLGDQTGHNKGQALGTVILDKLCDLVLFLLFLTVLPFWVATPDWLQPAVRTVGILAAVGIGFLILGLVRQDWMLTLVNRLSRYVPTRWRNGLVTSIRSLLEGLIMLRSPATLALAMAWSLALWGWDALAHFFVFRALGLDLPLVAAVFLSTALRASFAFPAMPGQVGIYEGIVVAGLGLFGVSSESALGVGLLRHAVDLVPPLIVTLLLLLFWQPTRSPEAANRSGSGRA